jgi:hypothetical protein
MVSWPHGYNLIGDSASYPPHVRVTPSGQSTRVWSSRTTDPRALATPAGGRIAAAWYAPDSFSVSVEVGGGQTLKVSLYFLDWDGRGRRERIDVLGHAGQVVDSRTVADFGGGVYLAWGVSGEVTFRITRLAGPDAVLSGLFFDSLPPPPSH